MSEKNCKERLAKHLTSRLRDIRKLWKLYKIDPEKYDDEIGKFNDYGIAFGAREDNGIVYFRWELSYGGPADGFNFYVDIDFNLVAVKYYFADWFDCAEKKLSKARFELLKEIWECYFKEYAKTIPRKDYY